VLPSTRAGAQRVSFSGCVCGGNGARASAELGKTSAFVKQPVSAECVPQPPPRQLLQGGKESFQSLHSRPNAPAAGCSVDAHLINQPSAEKARKVTTLCPLEFYTTTGKFLAIAKNFLSKTLPIIFMANEHAGFHWPMRDIC